MERVYLLVGTWPQREESVENIGIMLDLIWEAVMVYEERFLKGEVK
jgi:hypothetical protein